MFLCYFSYALPGTRQFWMIPLPGSAYTLAKITGAEEKHIIALESGNCFQIIQGFRIFYLQNNKALFVSLEKIFVKIQGRIRAIRVSAINRPAAYRVNAVWIIAPTIGGQIAPAM